MNTVNEAADRPRKENGSTLERTARIVYQEQQAKGVRVNEIQKETSGECKYCN